MKSKTEEEVIALVAVKMDEAVTALAADLGKQMDAQLGFTNIYYGGKPVTRDTDAPTDYFVVARNRLHRWWLTKIRRFPADKVFYLTDFKKPLELKVDLDKSLPKREGRVIKANTKPDYEPNISTKGGRVVRQIPRQLKKIKEAQHGTAEIDL